MINYRIKYNTDYKIFYKIYYGPITIKDIYSTWDEIINENFIPLNTTRFILDYSCANFNFPVSDHHLIPEYYKDNIDTFINSKIAVLTQNPKDIVIPILVMEKDKGYTSKPFSTEEAALNWLVSKIN